MNCLEVDKLLLNEGKSNGQKAIEVCQAILNNDQSADIGFLANYMVNKIIQPNKKILNQLQIDTNKLAQFAQKLSQQGTQVSEEAANLANQISSTGKAKIDANTVQSILNAGFTIQLAQQNAGQA